MERLIVTALLLVGLSAPAIALEPDKQGIYDTRSLILSYPIGIRNFLLFSQLGTGDSACFINSHSFRWDHFIHTNNDSCLDLGFKMAGMVPGDVIDISKASTIEVEHTFDNRCLIRKYNQWKFTEITVEEGCQTLGNRILSAGF